jgi:hypothetical protein
MHEDKRFEVSGEIPFDARRLIYGCFQPIHTMRRERACVPAIVVMKRSA